MKNPVGIDLFAGAGGLSLGFQQAGFRIAAAVEYDPVHAATHAFNFPDCSTICRSVSELNGAYVRERAGLSQDIDVVFGGAPCQGFSLIGKRALEDPRNQLVYHFVRLVKELSPKTFVFENVKGLTCGEHRRFLEEIISEFQRHGYQVRLPYKVLNATRFGVPQSRERLFLIGTRKDVPLPEYPAATHNPKPQDDELWCLPKTPTVWDAIADIPEADSFPELIDRDWIYAEFGDPSPYAKLLRKGNPRRGARRLLSSSLRTTHTPLSIKRFAKTKPGDVEPISRFLKLDPDGYCNTLRAGTGTERGAYTSPRPIHPYANRCITVREAARLHSYPDWFRFHATKWHGFRQVGNSVPPMLGRAVASAIASALGYVATNEAVDLSANVELLAMDMSSAARFFGILRKDIPIRARKRELATYA